MPTKLELLLEAEKRGILDDKNTALLSEARARGLVPSNEVPEEDKLNYEVDPELKVDTTQVARRQTLLKEGVKDIALGPAQLMNKVAKPVTGFIGAAAAKGSDLFRSDEDKLFADRSLGELAGDAYKSTKNVDKDLALRNQKLSALEDKTEGGTVSRLLPQVAATGPLTVGKKLPQWLAGGAMVGGAQPTSSEDLSANAKNAGIGAATMGIGNKVVPFVAEAGGKVVDKLVKGGGGIVDIGRRIFGSTNEAKGRLGKELAEGATDINVAQADRLAQAGEAKAINQDLQKRGIEGSYAPDDINNVDIGTEAVYQKFAGKDNAELTRRTNNETLVGKIVKAYSDPTIDTTKLGKKAVADVSERTAAIGAEETALANNTNEFFDTQTRPIKEQLDDYAKIARGDMKANAQVLDELGLKLEGVPPKEANLRIQKAIVERKKVLDLEKNSRYDAAEDIGKNHSAEVDANEAADIIGSDLLVGDTTKANKGFKTLFNVGKKGEIAQRQGVTFKTLLDAEKLVSQKMVDYSKKGKGAEIKALTPFHNFLKNTITKEADRIDAVSPGFKQTLASGDEFYKGTYAPTLKSRDIEGGYAKLNIDKALARLRKGESTPEQFLQDDILAKEEAGRLNVREILSIDPSTSADIQGVLIDKARKSSFSADGKFSQTRFSTFMRDYGPTLEEFPELAKSLQTMQGKLQKTAGAEDALNEFNTIAQRNLAEIESQRTAALGEQADAFKAQRAALGDELVSEVATKFNEDPNSFITKALNNPRFAQELSNVAGTNQEARTAVKQLTQEALERKALTYSGNIAKGNYSYLEVLANPSVEEMKSIRILMGDEAADNMMNAVKIVQRETVGNRGVNLPPEKLAGQVAGEAARGAALQAGATSAAASNMFTSIWKGVTNREIIKIAAKARTDPEFAYGIVQAYQNKNPVDLINLFKSAGDVLSENSYLLTPAATRAILPQDNGEGEPNEILPSNTPTGDGAGNESSIKKKFDAEANTVSEQSGTVTDRLATKFNLDPEYFHTVFNLESNYGRSQSNPNSSASGIAHFTDGTWKELVDRYGAKSGVTYEMKNDPRAQIVMLGYFTRENKEALKDVLKRDPTNAEMYISHVLGKAGGPRLLKNAGSTKSAASLFPEKVVKGNQTLFYTKDGKSRTPKGVYAELTKRYNDKKLAAAPTTPNQLAMR